VCAHYLTLLTLFLFFWLIIGIDGRSDLKRYLRENHEELNKTKWGLLIYPLVFVFVIVRLIIIVSQNNLWIDIGSVLLFLFFLVYLIYLHSSDKEEKSKNQNSKKIFSEGERFRKKDDDLEEINNLFVATIQNGEYSDVYLVNPTNVNYPKVFSDSRDISEDIYSNVARKKYPSLMANSYIFLESTHWMIFFDFLTIYKITATDEKGSDNHFSFSVGKTRDRTSTDKKLPVINKYGNYQELRNSEKS
jgi:Ca2+/Na+ antiporter